MKRDPKLLEGAEATVDPMPTTSRGSGGAAATSGYALDAPLTSGKEIPAARIMYRLGQNIDIDFGPVNNNLGGQEYSLVSKKWLDNISKCISRCNKCNQKLVHKTDGFSFAATYITHCKIDIVILIKILVIFLINLDIFL